MRHFHRIFVSFSNRSCYRKVELCGQRTQWTSFRTPGSTYSAVYGLSVGFERYWFIGIILSPVWCPSVGDAVHCGALGLCSRDVHGNGIPNGNGNPMGIPWEWD